MSAERGTPERLQELWVLLVREDAEAAGELWACREAWEQDRQLIAGLYEALEELEEAFGANDYPMSLTPALEKVERVLAKARGESNE